MKPVKLAVLTLALGAGLSACSEMNTPSPDATQVQLARATTATQTTGVDRSQLKLPTSGQLFDDYLPDLGRRAINPDDYVCPASTQIINWWLGEVVEFIQKEPATFDLLYNDLLADLVPTYEALYFQTDATPQYFGYDGEFNGIMTKTEKDATRFWDIDVARIQLIGMHGTMLTDVNRVARTYQYVFGLNANRALKYATQVRDAVLGSTVLDGGNHALFTFNAFAFTTYGTSIPDKIVMGDAILEGYRTLGFGDVAPQAIYAHELGHHIQYQKDYFSDHYATTGDAAEQTRYTELMADAMSAYFLTHSQGAAMNRWRVEQFLQVFYQIGDCSFSSSGHHGTPNQRIAAARFGFQVAADAQKQGKIYTADQFHALFVAAYPGIVAPDAP